jgi:hypothetical protein
VIEGVSEENGVFFAYDQVLIANPVTLKKKISALVRQKYSIDDEMSIQRQRYTKPEKFQEYFDYVEQCKTQVE